jgi:hypothetical protein
MPTPGNPRRDLHRETPRNSSPRPRTSVTDVPSDRPGISHRTRGAKHAPDPARAGKLDGKSASSVTRERPRGPARPSGDLPACLRPRHDPALIVRGCRMPNVRGEGQGRDTSPGGPIECLMSTIALRPAPCADDRRGGGADPDGRGPPCRSPGCGLGGRKRLPRSRTRRTCRSAVLVAEPSAGHAGHPAAAWD